MSGLTLLSPPAQRFCGPELNMMPCLWANRPLSMDVRAGLQIPVGVSALTNRTPVVVSLSKLGVSMMLLP